MAQDPRLAQQYQLSGEYEKAADLYLRLYQQAPNPYYFDRYIECLISLDELPKAESTIRKEIKSAPDNIELYVTLGGILDKLDKKEESEAAYRNAISQIRKDQFSIHRLGNAFATMGKTDLAIEVYEKGEKLFPDLHIYSLTLADLYKTKGDVSKMIGAYLNLLEVRPEEIGNVKTMFARGLSTTEFDELQKQLYNRIQQNQDSDVYPELLGWIFLQRNDYANALRQFKALDRRNQEDGLRVYGLAYG
ncbi:MAG: hypothetical protein ABIV51_01395, partial [Saprospiraceae bacterium]